MKTLWCILFSCLLVFLADPAAAQAKKIKEWEFSTPGGNLIGNNAIFRLKGTVLYDNEYTLYASFIRSAKFYDGFVVGESGEGYFIFDERKREATFFAERAKLIDAIDAQHLVPLSKSDISEAFNIGSGFKPMLVLLYIPLLLGFIYMSLGGVPMRTRIATSSFLVIEGVVLSLSVIWMLVGLGGFFMTLQFGEHSFNIDIVINFAMMVLAVGMIALMLYLNDEIVGKERHKLSLVSHLISFASIAIYGFWTASIVFNPHLPDIYWQGSF
jgi:hypothetical protein